MKAASHEKQGPAREVLVVGKMPDPILAAGEVCIRIAASGINPGDIKKREDAFRYGMPYPRVIPHGDGAGRVDQLGAGVPSEWMGRSAASSVGPWQSGPYNSAKRVRSARQMELPRP
jgi:NADPH2:quinone reductase